MIFVDTSRFVPFLGYVVCVATESPCSAKTAFRVPCENLVTRPKVETGFRVARGISTSVDGIDSPMKNAHVDPVARVGTGYRDASTRNRQGEISVMRQAAISQSQ